MRDETLSKAKGVFKKPKNKYYFGKIKFGTPYFHPWNHVSSIIRIYKDKPKFTKRNLYHILGFYVLLGSPIVIRKNELGWKDKFNSPRYEWSPTLYIYFFKWQFCMWKSAPDGENELYYEMMLWWLYYYQEYGCDKPNIAKAEKHWPWADYKTKQSTWNNEYINYDNSRIY